MSWKKFSPFEARGQHKEPCLLSTPPVMSAGRENYKHSSALEPGGLEAALAAWAPNGAVAFPLAGQSLSQGRSGGAVPPAITELLENSRSL